MGSSASKGGDNAENGVAEPAIRSLVKKKAFVTRVAAIATFQKRAVAASAAQLPAVRNRRQELVQFLREQKACTQESWKEVKQGATSAHAPGLNTMVLPKIPTQDEDVKREVQTMLGENDGLCFLCKEMATFNGYPCRICYKTFHKECLDKISKAKYSHGTLNVFLTNARTPGGGSCYECDNLGALLTDEEYQEITNMFEEFGVSMDATVPWDVFLSYHLHKEDDLFLDDVDHLRTQFSLLDLDGDKAISWWEFLTHEAGIKLTFRDPEELVDMLSLKEIARAKEMFNFLDKDKTGFILEKNVRAAFRAWYGRIDPSMKRLQRRKRLSCTPNMPSVVAQVMDEDPLVLKHHVDNASSMLMEGDKHNRG